MRPLLGFHWRFAAPWKFKRRGPKVPLGELAELVHGVSRRLMLSFDLLFYKVLHRAFELPLLPLVAPQQRNGVL
jgi:hypothetical protein